VPETYVPEHPAPLFCCLLIWFINNEPRLSRWLSLAWCQKKARAPHTWFRYFGNLAISVRPC